MFPNTRRRSFRNLTPTVDGLEGRRMLTSLSFVATVASPMDIKKTAPVAEVQKAVISSFSIKGTSNMAAPSSVSAQDFRKSLEIQSEGSTRMITFSVNDQGITKMAPAATGKHLDPATVQTADLCPAPVSHGPVVKS